MKRILRPLLLLTALAALMSVSVFAVDSYIGSGFYDIDAPGSVTLTPKTAESAKAQKLNVCWGSDETAKPSVLYSDSVKLDLTISNAVEGKNYLVMISDTEALPTKDSSIYYIDQIAKTSGNLTFNLYPKQIAESGEAKQVYLHITSDADGFTPIMIPMSYAHDKAYVQPAYKLGDVSDDGSIKTNDATMVLRHVAKLITLEGNAALAADCSGDGSIKTNDATLILKHVAKLIDLSTY